jgi:hypothetical protein
MVHYMVYMFTKDEVCLLGLFFNIIKIIIEKSLVNWVQGISKLIS